MKIFSLSLFISLLFPHFCYAQTEPEDLSADSTFFRQQSEAYQAWLDRSGFGTALSVHTITADSNLALYLKFPQNDPVICFSQWNQLKKDFEASRTMRLEQYLFYEMLHLMEIPQEIANIQMYNTYDLSETPCFLNAIYFEAGEVKTYQEFCRDKIMEIEVDPFDLDGLREISTAEFGKVYKKSTIYEALFNYAEKRFTKATCEQRYPEVRELERGQVLRFEVIDLCKEVLEDEEDSKICAVLNYFGRPCNWIKREKLEFTIMAEPKSEGFTLFIELSGKYGSGYYKKVRRGGYHSMEPDFEDYLDAYADRIKLEFQKVIENLKEEKP